MYLGCRNCSWKTIKKSWILVSRYTSHATLSDFQNAMLKKILYTAHHAPLLKRFLWDEYVSAAFQVFFKFVLRSWKCIVVADIAYLFLLMPCLISLSTSTFILVVSVSMFHDSCTNVFWVQEFWRYWNLWDDPATYSTQGALNRWNTPWRK